MNPAALFIPRYLLRGLTIENGVLRERQKGNAEEIRDYRRRNRVRCVHCGLPLQLKKYDSIKRDSCDRCAAKARKVVEFDMEAMDLREHLISNWYNLQPMIDMELQHNPASSNSS